MKEKDLQNIWKMANESGQKTYSLDEIQEYRKQKNRQTAKSSKLTIIFDITLKTIIFLGLIYLLTINNQSSVHQIIGFLMGICLSLIIVEIIFLRKQRRFTDSKSIIESLKQKINYLKTTHKPFILLSAISNPLFVLTGFLFYYHYKYGEVDVKEHFQDPVIYVFIIAAFAISYFAQLPVFKSQLRELHESIEDIEDLDNHLKMASFRIEKAKKRRRMNIFVFSALTLLGVILLILILML